MEEGVKLKEGETERGKWGLVQGRGILRAVGMFCLAKKDVSRENKPRWRGKKRRCRAAEEKRVEYGGGWGVGSSLQRALATRANTTGTIRQYSRFKAPKCSSLQRAAILRQYSKQLQYYCYYYYYYYKAKTLVTLIYPQLTHKWKFQSF